MARLSPRLYCNCRIGGCGGCQCWWYRLQRRSDESRMQCTLLSHINQHNIPRLGKLSSKKRARSIRFSVKAGLILCSTRSCHLPIMSGTYRLISVFVRFSAFPEFPMSQTLTSHSTRAFILVIRIREKLLCFHLHTTARVSDNHDYKRSNQSQERAREKSCALAVAYSFLNGFYHRCCLDVYLHGMRESILLFF